MHVNEIEKKYKKTEVLSRSNKIILMLKRSNFLKAYNSLSAFLSNCQTDWKLIKTNSDFVLAYGHIHYKGLNNNN